MPATSPSTTSESRRPRSRAPARSRRSSSRQLSGPNGRPPNQGTTLLAGHVDYTGQGTGTLYDLYRVQPGTLVYASDASGHVPRWRVTGLTVVSKTELPSWVFAGTAGPRKLVIVTCGGPVDYVPGYGNTYRDNVIATAVPL
ncbi:class F sortase [Actinospica robiniae]|uniref:class F sortase n=1 Tax=Actinospica robiniae TaxID=304901 RepID=UPI00041CFDCA|nr:class F sortase [Actinospica robiniae]